MIQDNVLVSFTKEALIYQAKFKTQPRILQNHIGLNYSLIKRFLWFYLYGWQNWSLANHEIRNLFIRHDGWAAGHSDSVLPHKYNVVQTFGKLKHACLQTLLKQNKNFSFFHEKLIIFTTKNCMKLIQIIIYKINQRNACIRVFYVLKTLCNLKLHNTVWSHKRR